MEYTLISPADISYELSGTQFRKQVLRRGTFRHPSPMLRDDEEYNLSIDDDFIDQAIANFDSKIIDSVKYIQSHDEDSSVLGSLVKLEKAEDGLYGIFDIPDDEARKRITTKDANGRSLADGVSLGIDYNPTMSEVKEGDSQHKGPVIRHVAAATIPWIKGMSDWTEVDVAAADKVLMSDDENKKHPLFYQGGPSMTEVESALKVLADSKGMDVGELSKLVGLSDKKEEEKPKDDKSDDLAQKIAAFLSDKVDATDKKEETKEDEKPDVDAIVGEKVKEFLAPLGDIMKGITTELGDVNKRNADLTSTLANSEADVAIKSLVDAGKITPAEKENYAKLYMSDKSLFKTITDTLPAKVTFEDTETDESGAFQRNPYSVKLSDEQVKENVDKYIKMVEKKDAGDAHQVSGLQIGAR